VEASVKIPEPRVEAEPTNGLARLPWHDALYHQVNALQAELDEQKAANARLRAENSGLRQNLRLAKQRLENWALRQQAWRVERAELDRRIKSFSSS